MLLTTVTSDSALINQIRSTAACLCIKRSQERPCQSVLQVHPISRLVPINAGIITRNKFNGPQQPTSLLQADKHKDINSRP